MRKLLISFFILHSVLCLALTPVSFESIYFTGTTNRMKVTLSMVEELNPTVDGHRFIVDDGPKQFWMPATTNLAPSVYVMSIEGIRKQWQIAVADTTNTLYAANLATELPLYYLSAGSILSVKAGTNVTASTNGSEVTISTAANVVTNGQASNLTLGGGTGDFITARSVTLPFNISDVPVDAANGWLSFLGFDNGVVASNFLGSAAQLTNGNATSFFSSGTIPTARLPTNPTNDLRIGLEAEIGTRIGLATNGFVGSGITNGLAGTNWVAGYFVRTNTLPNPYGTNINIAVIATGASYEAPNQSPHNLPLGGYLSFMVSNQLAPWINVVTYSNSAISGSDMWNMSNDWRTAIAPAIAKAKADGATAVFAILGLAQLNDSAGLNNRGGSLLVTPTPYQSWGYVTNWATQTRLCGVTNNIKVYVILSIPNAFLSSPEAASRWVWRQQETTLLLGHPEMADGWLDGRAFMSEPGNTNQFDVDKTHPNLTSQTNFAIQGAHLISCILRGVPVPIPPGAFTDVNLTNLFGFNGVFSSLVWSNNAANVPNLVIDAARSSYGLNMREEGSGFANPEIWRIQEWLPGLCSNIWTGKILTTGSSAAAHHFQEHYRLINNPYTDTAVRDIDGNGNQYVLGWCAATNGFISGATNTYSITATGYTNTSGINIRIVGLTGTSIVQSNAAIPLIFSRGTITTPTDVILQPRESITGSSVAAQSMQAF